jgi:hypothetical protein
MGPTDKSVIAMSEIVYLIGRTIDLALYARVSSCAAAFVLENGA